jgi:hypothetical protein
MVYEELKNLSYGKSHCDDLSSTNPVSIHIKTDAGRRINDYRCAKNVCTQEIQYNSSSPTDDAEDESAMTKRIREETEMLIFQRATSIVALLVIIGCIAYFIQYRKYRQGYRLTKTIA